MYQHEVMITLFILCLPFSIVHCGTGKNAATDKGQFLQEEGLLPAIKPEKHTSHVTEYEGSGIGEEIHIDGDDVPVSDVGISGDYLTGRNTSDAVLSGLLKENNNNESKDSTKQMSMSSVAIAVIVLLMVMLLVAVGIIGFLWNKVSYMNKKKKHMTNIVYNPDVYDSDEYSVMMEDWKESRTN